MASQLVLLLIAAAVVAHGLFGPPIAPRNLSTVLTSIHWRGFLIVGLLVAGNLMCATCPMILVRDAGRRLIAPRFTWPRLLRRKWLGVLLLALVLFSYELFDFWALPGATAWIVVGYFALALAVDLLFKGASFCKHVCPIGQFNFVASTMSPTELKVADAATCRSCRTYDCIKGQQAAVAPLRVVQRGCELGLFLPSKVGNLDCTLCLDCVRACPHDNIALTTRLPGLELLDSRRRSGIGRLARRPDIAALAVVFTFAALLNAFAMTAPAFTLEEWLATSLNVSSEVLPLGVLFVGGLVALPLVLLTGAGAVTAMTAGIARKPLGETVVQYAPSLVPLGFGVWLAHYGFHLFTGVLTAAPVAQSAAIDLLGWSALGEPAWQWAGMPPGLVYPLQLGFVLLAAGGSLGLVYATSTRDYPKRPALTAMPWLALITLLSVAALWIFTLPMEMRGLDGIG